MAFQPDQYEHIPHDGEDSYYTYTYTYSGQSTSSNDGHDTSHLHPQSHETAALNRPPVSPISRDIHTEDHQSLQFQQNNEYHPAVYQQPAASNFEYSHEPSDVKAPAYVSSVEKRRKSSCLDGLSDWWWWELGSVLLSLACFAAIIITLVIMQDKALSSWHSAISPNAFISTLATISKASLMLAVAACISQLKWLYFERAPRPLHSMQIFDDASRGPLGALELLARLSPREVFLHRSGGAAWTFWASILTILALALDPFAQQILSFPLRSVPNSTGSQALITTSQVYDTRVNGGITDSENKNVDMAMQGAIQNGLYTLNSPMSFTCTTANCTWPVFYTVGVCSSCTNVTDRVNATCSSGGYGGGQQCNYTLPSGFKLSASHWTSSGGGHATPLNATAVRGKTGFNTNITDWIVRVGMIRTGNGAGNYSRPEAFVCSLSWCAKRYSKVEVTKGQIATPSIASWKLESPHNIYSRDYISFNAFEVANDTGFDGPNRTFTVNSNDHVTLSGWLTDSFFTTAKQDAVARALYLQNDVSQTFANIATSMTNTIREGLNSTPVYGTSYREETYIHVTWTWLVLPGLVVLMGAVLLAASMFLTRGDKEGLWKNSILAALFTQMRGWDHEGLRVGRWSQMGDQAEAIRGTLQRDGQGGLTFMRT